MKLILVALLIRFGLSGAVENHGYSAQCQNCIEPCTMDPETENYKCKTKKWYNKAIKNNTDWDFCSPSEKINHLGYNCTNNCDFHGKDYQWCTDQYYWGYCSGESCKTHHGYSAYCQNCIEPCKMDNKTENYKCKTVFWKHPFKENLTDWDWCSPSVNQTHWGDNCTTECALHGKDYQWCGDSDHWWGYCSGQSCTSEKIELPDHGYSANCKMCIEPCKKDNKTKKYKCKTYPFYNRLTDNYTDWDWCSPSVKQNHHGAECTNECDFHDKDYKWCTDSYQWGYCSPENCTVIKMISKKEEPSESGYSTHCKKCTERCKMDNKTETYRCKTDTWYNAEEGKNKDWDFCSQSENLNHRGENCTKQCDFHGGDYQWCEGNKTLEWGYCSGQSCTLQQPETKDYGYSSNCKKCIGRCKIDPNTRSYKCKTYLWYNKIKNNETDWDYCSLSDKETHRGGNCINECAFYGEDYHWCTTTEESGWWGFCSGNYCKSEQPELKDYGYSSYCQRCIEPCQKNSNDEHWCRTLKFTLKNYTRTDDVCSPDSSVDYRGRLCKNTCGFNEDKDYQWCKVERVSGDKQNDIAYCSGKEKVLCDFVGDL